MAKTFTLAACTQCRRTCVADADENESQRSAHLASLLAEGWTTDPAVCPRCNLQIRGELTPTLETRGG